jgi:probable F420-dependent oxidoreductase
MSDRLAAVPLTPFRFGAAAFSASSAAHWADRARQIETLGYSSLLIGDHPAGNSLGPFSALTAAAAATSTLRVGCTVFANDYRHPAVLAKEAVTLDFLSDGRFELGLGAGWSKREYDQAGFAFDPPATRVERLDEAIQILRSVWSGEPVVFTGKHYRLDGLQLTPRPTRPLHLFIGGGGKSLLSIAGQYASSVGILARALPDGSGLDLGSDTLATVSTRVGWVRDAAGERFTQLELAALIQKVLVTDDRESAAATIAGQGRLTPEQILRSPYFLLGSIDAITDQVEALRANCGISYLSVFPGDVDAFSPVVARLAGR